MSAAAQRYINNRITQSAKRSDTMDHSSPVFDKFDNKFDRQLERVLPNGNIVCYTSDNPPKKERYVNPKIEEELVEFKQEIEEKHNESKNNKTYKFPLPLLTSNDAYKQTGL